MSEMPPADTAWVLHRRPYRNTSLIVEMLSAEGGRVAAVARAGRKQPHLQPFRPLTVFLGGRGELRSLKNAEPAGAAINLRGEALYCGLYLNELLVRLLHRDDPQHGLTGLYHQALTHLCDQQWPRDLVLRHFERALLDTLGYGLSLDRDVNGQPLASEARYRLVADEGLMLAATGRYLGEHLLAFAADDWQRDEVRRAARDLMREALAPHIGDRPLMSRELFRHGVTERNEGEQ